MPRPGSCGPSGHAPSDASGIQNYIVKFLTTGANPAANCSDGTAVSGSPVAALTINHTGLATATKWNGGLVLAVPLLALGPHAQEQPRERADRAPADQGPDGCKIHQRESGRAQRRDRLVQEVEEPHRGKGDQVEQRDRIAEVDLQAGKRNRGRRRDTVDAERALRTVAEALTLVDGAVEPPPLVYGWHG